MEKEFFILVNYKFVYSLYYSYILLLSNSDNPPPYVDGVRINSPHYLCKMLEEGPATYTLVISQVGTKLLIFLSGGLKQS